MVNVSSIIPQILTQLTQYAVPLIALMFCGRLGKLELDVVSLANSVINVTGIGIASGVTAACDTLFSQIYGSVKRHKLGVALQKSLILTTLCILPCWAVQINAENLLRALGQDPVIASLTAEYLLICTPGLLAFFIYASLSKYVQNQNIIVPNLIIGLTANIINAILHYIFIFVLDYGLHGSAFAQTSTYVCFLLLTIVYIMTSGIYKKTWSGWSMECFENWGQFFLLSAFGLLMICAEWFSFEAGLFMAGALGPTELGTQAVLLQICFLRYNLPLGLGIAASIRVGQYLGAGNTKGATTVTAVSFTLVWCLYFVLAVILGSLRNYIPLMYTNVKEVATLVANTLPILIGIEIFDDSIGVAAGILRGAGKQNIGAVINCSLYGLAVPLAYVFMFTANLKVAGFWYAIGCATALETVLFMIVLFRANWKKLSKQAHERVGVNDNEGLGEEEECLVVSDEENSDDLVHFSVITSDEDSYHGPKCIRIQNVAVILGFFAVLVIGILCRVLVPPESMDLSTALPYSTATTPNPINYSSVTSF